MKYLAHIKLMINYYGRNKKAILICGIIAIIYAYYCLKLSVIGDVLKAKYSLSQIESLSRVIVLSVGFLSLFISYAIIKFFLGNSFFSFAKSVGYKKADNYLSILSISFISTLASVLMIIPIKLFCASPEGTFFFVIKYIIISTSLLLIILWAISMLSIKIIRIIIYGIFVGMLCYIYMKSLGKSDVINNNEIKLLIANKLFLMGNIDIIRKMNQIGESYITIITISIFSIIVLYFDEKKYFILDIENFQTSKSIKNIPLFSEVFSKLFFKNKYMVNFLADLSNMKNIMSIAICGIIDGSIIFIYIAIGKFNNSIFLVFICIIIWISSFIAIDIYKAENEYVDYLKSIKISKFNLLKYKTITSFIISEFFVIIFFFINCKQIVKEPSIFFLYFVICTMLNMANICAFTIVEYKFFPNKCTTNTICLLICGLLNIVPSLGFIISIIYILILKKISKATYFNDWERD